MNYNAIRRFLPPSIREILDRLDALEAGSSGGSAQIGTSDFAKNLSANRDVALAGQSLTEPFHLWLDNRSGTDPVKVSVAAQLLTKLVSSGSPNDADAIARAGIIPYGAGAGIVVGDLDGGSTIPIDWASSAGVFALLTNKKYATNQYETEVVSTFAPTGASALTTRADYARTFIIEVPAGKVVRWGFTTNHEVYPTVAASPPTYSLWEGDDYIDVLAWVDAPTSFEMSFGSASGFSTTIV